MELQGLVGLKYFPETRAILADSEIGCRRQGHLGMANVTTSMIMRRSTSSRWTNPRVTWEVQSCIKRNLWHQYSKVGQGFRLAHRHAVMTGQPYDVAVRARTDVMFQARVDLAAMHLGYLSRDATLKASGEYVATEANGFCGGLSVSGATELCWTMQLSDGFMIGSAALMIDLWRNMSSMDASYACCEEIVRWNMAFRVGIRQAQDEDQEPTLPKFESFASTELPQLEPADMLWFKGDKMRPNSGCPLPNKEKKMPKHELCVLPARHSNHDPWQRLGTSHTRTAKYTLAVNGPKGNQILAPYRAPLWRFKPGLGYGIKPEPMEKQKVTMLHGVKVAHVTKMDAVATGFKQLGKCSHTTMKACAEQLEDDAKTVPDKDAKDTATAGGKRRNSSAACPVMRKPCRKCHFWVTDEDGRACLPPNAVLPTVLSSKVRGHVRGGLDRNAGKQDVLG